MVVTIGRGEVGALVLLDRSAAFDTIDNRTILAVLQKRFHSQDASLDRFTSYFADRTHLVIIGADSSLVGNLRDLWLGAPHGPRQFVV